MFYVTFMWPMSSTCENKIHIMCGFHVQFGEVHNIVWLSTFYPEIKNKNFEKELNYKIKLCKVYHLLFSNGFLCTLNLKTKNPDICVHKLKNKKLANPGNY